MAMSISNQTLPCILYKETVRHGGYDMVKSKVKIEDATHRTRTLPCFSGDKGVEGLFYVYHKFIL